MDTKWKNIKSKAKSFLEKCWLSSTGIAVKLFCFVLAGFGIAFWYSVVVYRTYHPTGESLFFGILGNALFGAGQMILTAFLIMRKFREWDPGEKDAYVKWQNRWKIRNRRLQWIGGTALLIALWYMSYLMNGGMYIGTGWQYNYASGYVMILSALVQFVLAGAVMNHFKKKQLDMIMCNFEKINQNRIKEALEIERKSLEKVSRSDQLRVDLITNVSHDLKTPLASITGYSQGIVSNVIKDHQKAASIILSESLRMTDLVESILSLSKMDSHTFDLHPTDLEVMEFLDECVDIMSTIRRDCVIHLEAERPLMIHTDPELLKRVIQNILSNCLRYAEHEILIRMSTDGNSLILLIQDDGPGFLEKDLPHIFERFYKGNGGKNGIGLSIVWTGIHYLGGSITAGNRAVPEHGAYYQLLLPLSF